MVVSTTATTSANCCRFLMLRLVAFLLISSLSGYTTSAAGLGSNSMKKGVCKESEMLSLLALKEGIFKPPSWLSSWRAGTDCCSWQEIGCDYTTGHVIKLNLRYPYDDQVPGPSKLTSSLLGLVHLKHLDLSLNNFSGQPIPKFIGSLVKLEYLNISLAGFSGTIPPHLGNLSALRFLDLNSFSYYSDSSILWVDEGGLDWVSKITSLVYLDMSFVDLFNANDNWIRSINMLPSLSVLLLTSAKLEKIPSSLPQVNFTSLTMLDLSSNQFHSTIPNWLFNIITLLHLELIDCDITGDIQDFLGSFIDLVYLDLNVNRITGEIPRNIGKLSRMEFLNLWGNNIEGKIPETMGSLCKLSFLDLSRNMIGGQITGFVEELSRCVGGSNLQSVSLRYNRLNGTIPAAIGDLLNLQLLDLASNSFVGNLTEVHFSNLSNLFFLAVSYNNFEMIFSPSWTPSFNASIIYMCSCHMGPRFPAWLRTQTSLEELCISEAGILENIPHWFWDIDIVELNVSHNQFTGQLPPSLATRKYRSLDLSSNSFEGKILSFDPTFLYYIDLSNNSFSGPIPLSLANGSYSFFSLSNNHLTGSIPPFYFNNSQSLQILDLSNNNFDGRLPSLVSANNSSLVVIDLSSNNFSGDIFDSIGSFTSLQSLHLRNNSLLGSIPRSLRHCKQLVVLDIGENRFSGIIPTWMGESLASLRVLRLRSNSFSGNIPSQISLLANLQVLDLSNNNLSGILPPSFWNFKAMMMPLKVEKSMLNDSSYRENILITTKGIETTYTTVLSLVVDIDLSNNGLYGEIHEELTELHGLQFLNLSKNHFTGKIPENIGFLRQLESLDISMNGFSGNIPPSISSLNFLEHLNLSHNNLSGRIPMGEQIQSLDDPSIYGGNQDLCGWPLPECPVDEPAEPSIERDGGDDTDKIWLYATSAGGFIMGFWCVIGTLMIKVSLRISFFRIIDRFYDWIYVKLAIYIARIKAYGEAVASKIETCLHEKAETC